jgi:hypothetical protein
MDASSGRGLKTHTGGLILPRWGAGVRCFYKCRGSGKKQIPRSVRDDCAGESCESGHRGKGARYPSRLRVNGWRSLQMREEAGGVVVENFALCFLADG